MKFLKNHYKLVLCLIIFSIGFLKESEGQELEVLITTDKNIYERLDTIHVTYWIENTADSPIVFLERSGLTVSKHCFEIYGANEDLRRKNYGNMKKEDFITIGSNETRVKTHPYIIYWLCRSTPLFEDWILDVSYGIKRDDSKNFYYENGNEENRNKVFVDAWTGTIESNIDEVIILRKNY